MKSHFLTPLLALAFLAEATAQTIPLYQNFGDISGTAPVIDATAFANYGSFSVSTTLPYDFQSTRFFTNRGTMNGDPGFRFATASSLGTPFRPADTFVNDVGAGVNSGLSGGGGAGGGFGGGSTVSPSYLLVNADNILNRGTLVSGSGGLVQIQGENVDLAHSGLGIGRLELSSSHFITPTNFIPDTGITDLYWNITNDFGMRMANLLRVTKTATNATSPSHQVFTASGFPNFVQLSVSITNTNMGAVSVVTNVGGKDPTSGLPTNVLRQAAFVAVSDTNLLVTVKWAPSSIPTNSFQTAIVEIKLGDTNVITGDLEFSTLYLKDELASGTNYVLLTNLQSSPMTFMPGTFDLTRNPPQEWLTAVPGKPSITNTFYFNASDTNAIPVVTNFFAAYAADVSSLAGTPPNVPDLQIEDYPGRVEIDATNLDLTRTRIRALALATIKTPNLMASTGVEVDSQNVVYNLSVPSGPMSLQGFAKDRVVRLNGQLRAWAGVFTNFFGTTVTNQVTDPNTGSTTNVATNVVTEIDAHMLIVDATGLQATLPVTTYDFITHADEIVLNDPLRVTRSFIVDATNFTLNSSLSLSGGVPDWTSTNSPRLQFFTSKGTLDVANVANLGADVVSGGIINGGTPIGWTSFINRGLLGANGILIRSTSFENSGSMTSRVDGIQITAGTASFQNSGTLSARDLQITGMDMRFTGSTNAAVGTIVLTATNSLADAGESDTNVFRSFNGIQLPVKPALGDLLGSTVLLSAPRFAQVESVWAGEDRGASTAGYQDNVAIGHLILTGDTEVIHVFHAAGAKNAMYVDFLELAGPLTNAVSSGDLTSSLQIDPALTIYFATSNVDTNQLEQLSGGRLVHVDFNGAATVMVQVPLRNGGTAEMSQALRQSTTIDSDGDGIPNAYDAYPLSYDTPVRLSGFRAAGQTVIALSWQAAPNSNYQVEYATDLQNPVWQPLSTFSNTGSSAQTATAQDTITNDQEQRYYRVRTQ